jgi:copper chaperone
MLRLEISGMTCGGCARSVTRAVQAVPGVVGAAVDLEAATVTVEGEAAADAVRQAIERAGYAVQRVVS